MLRLLIIVVKITKNHSNIKEITRFYSRYFFGTLFAFRDKSKRDTV